MGPVIDNESADLLTESFLELMMRGGRPIRHLERPIEGRPFLLPALIDVTEMRDRPDIELFGPILQVIRAGPSRTRSARRTTRATACPRRWSARTRRSTTSSGPMSAPASSTGTGRPTAPRRAPRSAASAGRATIARAPITRRTIAPIRWFRPRPSRHAHPHRQSACATADRPGSGAAGERMGPVPRKASLNCAAAASATICPPWHPCSIRPRAGASSLSAPVPAIPTC